MNALFIPILAQVDLVSKLSEGLAQYGPVGIVLLWLMFRVEKRMDKHSSIVNDLAEAITLDVLSRENITPAARERAGTLADRIATRTRAHSSDVQ